MIVNRTEFRVKNFVFCYSNKCKVNYLSCTFIVAFIYKINYTRAFCFKMNKSQCNYKEITIHKRR